MNIVIRKGDWMERPIEISTSLITFAQDKTSIIMAPQLKLYSLGSLRKINKIRYEDYVEKFNYYNDGKTWTEVWNDAIKYIDQHRDSHSYNLVNIPLMEIYPKNENSDLFITLRFSDKIVEFCCHYIKECDDSYPRQVFNRVKFLSSILFPSLDECDYELLTGKKETFATNMLSHMACMREITKQLSRNYPKIGNSIQLRNGKTLEIIKIEEIDAERFKNFKLPNINNDKLVGLPIYYNNLSKILYLGYSFGEHATRWYDDNMHDSQWRRVRARYKTLKVKFPTVSALNEFFKMVPSNDNVDIDNNLQLMEILSEAFGVVIEEHENEYEEER